MPVWLFIGGRQKLLARGGIKFGSDNARVESDEALLVSLLFEWDGSTAPGKKAQLQLLGSSLSEEQAFAESAAATEKAAAITVVNDLDIDYDLVAEERRIASRAREREHRRKDASSTPYRFNELKPLPQFKDSEKAREILEDLATDPGFLAVMRKHRWTVGTLSEMYPEGLVGIDPVCVLGLNVNKGQEIKLRLRTDDLQGFRKRLDIRKVLCHELSHNVHGDHDEKFYKLMRQIERELEDPDVDWRKGKGHTLGGQGAFTASLVARKPRQDGPVGGVYKLGGETGESILTKAASKDATAQSPVISSDSDVAMTVDESPGCACGNDHVQSLEPTQDHEQPKSQELKPQELKLQEQLEAERLDSDEQTRQSGSRTSDGQNANNPIELDLDSRDLNPSATLPSLPPLAEEKLLDITSAVGQLIERNDLHQADKSMDFLSKVLRKILEHPLVSKYRRIKMSATAFQDNVSRVLGARHVLQVLGWQLDASKDGDFLCLVDESDAALSVLHGGIVALANAKENLEAARQEAAILKKALKQGAAQ